MLISFFILFNLLSEDLFALLASEDHFGGWFKFVVLCLHVALWAVKPLFAAWGTDGHLGVHDVFAHI